MIKNRFFYLLLTICIAAGINGCSLNNQSSLAGADSSGAVENAAGKTGEDAAESNTEGNAEGSTQGKADGSTDNTETTDNQSSVDLEITLETLPLDCEYLKNPEAIIPIAEQSAEFWKKAIDKEYGGFFTYIDRDGSVDGSRQFKVTFLQSRDAYAFARAYQLTGKKEYLDYARNALDFMYQYAWDDKNGGWYQEMNRDGSLAETPLEGMDWNRYKFFFNQMYALCGINAMADATRSKADTEWLIKAYNAQNLKLWDGRPGYEGYFDMASADWSNLSDKSLGTNMDGITTHAETYYLFNLKPENKQRFLLLADNLNNIVKTMEGRQFGFIEYYDKDWNPLAVRPQTTSGNFLKPAWCLARAYLVEPKEEYREGAAKLIDQLLASKAYDSENGGGYTLLDTQTGNPIEERKTWWELEQAVTSGLTNYYISRDIRYLKMADQSMDFFMNHMYDAQFGDVYNSTDAKGENPDTVKGNYWKGVYHSMELFYYTYLYGNLMLQNKPVTLYYSIDPVGEEREISLNPVSLGKNKLLISSVALDGKVYRDFEPERTLLKLPANVGGEFRVTFKSDASK